MTPAAFKISATFSRKSAHLKPDHLEIKFRKSRSTESFREQENSQDTEEEIPDDCHKCPVCEVLFLSKLEDFDFEQHVMKHFVYECPVCQRSFPENRQVEYEDHVQSHFLECN